MISIFLVDNFKELKLSSASKPVYQSSNDNISVKIKNYISNLLNITLNIHLSSISGH